MQTASDEIVDGTAVYIDGTLRFVTTEGDHLRTYLESIKAPFENDMDSSIRTGFVHDIRLLDGVYLQESIMSYSATTDASRLSSPTAVSSTSKPCTDRPRSFSS